MPTVSFDTLGRSNPNDRAILRFFHPVLAARELGHRPVRVELGGEAFALFRSSAGPAAVLDRCAHRFSRLSSGQVREGRLECPYHGWTYDAGGDCRAPADPERVRCSVPRFQVIERAGALWLGGPEADPATLPTLAFDGYRSAGSFAMRFDAPLHVAFDNFSENEHTPWVHARFGWDRAHCREIEFTCERDERSTRVSYSAPQRRTALGPLFGLRPGDLYHNHWETRFDPPRTQYDIHWTSKDGARRPFATRVVIYFVPEHATRTRFHVFTFARSDSAVLRLAAPLTRHLFRLLTWSEVRDDARFVGTVADVPYELAGMQLGRFDKPLAMNRELLERIYYDRAAEPVRLRRRE